MEEQEKVLKYLNWRYKHNQCEINNVQIAKALDIEDDAAKNIIEELHRKSLLLKYYRIQCPYCSQYTEVPEKSASLIPLECGNKECENKFEYGIRYYKYDYYYKINEDFFEEQREEGVIMPFRTKKDPTAKVKVFLSYAHEDEAYKTELDKHLAVQKRGEKIQVWNDRELKAGKFIHDEIDEHLTESDLIILLLSADFFDSEYCYCVEMQKAIQLNEKGENIIIPVIVRPCDWLDSPLKQIVALPQDGKPINMWENQDEAYMNIVQGIKEAIAEIQNEKTGYREDV